VGQVAGTTSRRQGCPSWGGIWRKPKAKSRSDEQEPDIRLSEVDEFATQNEVQQLPWTSRSRSGG